MGGKAIQGSKGHEIGQPKVQKGQILLQWYIVASAMWLSLPIKLYMSSSNWGRRLNGMKESFLHIYHASSALKYAIDNICVCFRQTNTVDVWEISILYFIDNFNVF